MSMKKNKIKTVSDLQNKNKTEEALRLMREDKNDREKKCREDIDSVLKKYNCCMVPQMMLSPGRIDPIINIVAN